MSTPGWLSIALSLAAIAISLNTIRTTRKTRQIIDETNRALAAPPKPSIPRFATIGDCMTAAYRMEFLPGDRIGCAHCPWTGNSFPKFASHLLTCPED